MIGMKKNKYFLITCILLSLLVFSACDSTSRSETKYTAKKFPLSIELDKTDYKVGDTVSFTLTITNKCGRTVTLYSNGEMPCVNFQNIKNRLLHGEISLLTAQEFKKNEKISRDFSFIVEKTGTYILDAHYNIAINSHRNPDDWFREKLDDIRIVVTL
jgi:hypothetical protein